MLTSQSEKAIRDYLEKYDILEREHAELLLEELDHVRAERDDIKALVSTNIMHVQMSQLRAKLELAVKAMESEAKRYGGLHGVLSEVYEKIRGEKC